MIELLMVIMIIAVLGAVALPQFLDFRKEARRSSIQRSLSALKSGIKNQIQQAMLKCSQSVGYYPHLGLIIRNDITDTTWATNPCTAAQIPNPSERRFVDEIPKNPYTGTSDIGDLGTTYAGPYNPISVCDLAATLAMSGSIAWGAIVFNYTGGPNNEVTFFAATTQDDACAIS